MVFSQQLLNKIKQNIENVKDPLIKIKIQSIKKDENATLKSANIDATDMRLNIQHSTIH